MITGSDCPSTQSQHATNRPSYQCQQLKEICILTQCNYSQPTLIKLDNENIGGHLTPLHGPRAQNSLPAELRPLGSSSQSSKTTKAPLQHCQCYRNVQYLTIIMIIINHSFLVNMQDINCKISYLKWIVYSSNCQHKGK